jgi:lipoate-protein ligase A
MDWRILISGKRPPYENMAVDEAIMQGVIRGDSPPTIRFYDWDPPTVSCGYNQEAEKEVDFQLLAKYGLGFVRRPTGGRIVLHDHEVTYSVIAPVKGRLGGNVTQAYSEISMALGKGMKIMGIPVELEKCALSAEHQRQPSNPCFSSTSRFELSHRSRKIVGSAQVRKEDVLLQHGSILLNFDQSKIAEIIPGLEKDKREKLAGFLKKKTVSVNEISEKRIDFESAVKGFIRGFKACWPQDGFEISENLAIAELESSKRLIQDKYSTDDWNKRK